MNIDFESLGFGTHFGVLDWIIVIGYLLAVVSVGVYIRKYIASATDFMVAGRGLKTFLAIATMIGTELGLVTVMYSSQKGFTGGFAAFHIAFAAAIVTLFVGLSGFIVVPLRRLKVMTIPEFYEKRFGRDVRILGGIILALSGILNMGMFLKAGSLFVMGVTGMTSEIHLKIVMTVLLCMVLLYTTLGGMVSVAILDYIQFVVLSFGLVFASVMSIRYLGWSHIVDTVTREMGQSGFNPFDEAGFGWSYVMWMFFMGLVSCAVWQTAVIRACSAKSTGIVKRIYTLSSLGFLIRFLIPYFFGICALVFIAGNETLRGVFLSAEGKGNSDLSLTAMPFYLSQILPTGLLGIICAGMLAAFMSTHDSYLLCWSSVLTQDVVTPLVQEWIVFQGKTIANENFYSWYRHIYSRLGALVSPQTGFVGLHGNLRCDIFYRRFRIAGLRVVLEKGQQSWCVSCSACRLPGFAWALKGPGALFRILRTHQKSIWNRR